MSDSSVSQLGLFDTVGIPLTKGYVAIVSAVDADLIDLKWTAAVNEDSGKVYAYRHKRLNGRQTAIRLHRVVLERVIGRPLLKSELVDHKDGNPLNNHRENLRIASPRQNLENAKRSSRNTSGFKGVSYFKTRENWRATIRIDGRSVHLGYFDDPKEAHAAYCKSAVEHFGEFARFA